MGLEQRCTARFGDQVSPGKASLESQALAFRGGFRLEIPFGEITRVTVDGADLQVTWSGGEVALDLGTAAARWADRLSRPRSRLDKLGVRPGARVTVFTVDDPTLVPELGQRASVVYLDIPREPMDVVFFGVTQPSQLHRVGYLRWYLRRDGALWLVRPTGSVKVTEAQVLAAGRGARMVDTRVVSLAPGLTAHRFVFPLTAR